MGPGLNVNKLENVLRKKLLVKSMWELGKGCVSHFCAQDFSRLSNFEELKRLHETLYSLLVLQTWRVSEMVAVG